MSVMKLALGVALCLCLLPFLVLALLLALAYEAARCLVYAAALAIAAGVGVVFLMILWIPICPDSFRANPWVAGIALTLYVSPVVGILLCALRAPAPETK